MLCLYAFDDCCNFFAGIQKLVPPKQAQWKTPLDKTGGKTNQLTIKCPLLSNKIKGKFKSKKRKYRTVETKDQPKRPGERDGNPMLTQFVVGLCETGRQAGQRNVRDVTIYAFSWCDSERVERWTTQAPGGNVRDVTIYAFS